MKTTYAATIALAIATLASGHAMAADASVSQAASYNAGGDVVEPTTGMKLRDLNPSYYGASVAVQGKTRTQVTAELMQARVSNAGDVVEPTTGMKLRDLNPSQYAAAATVQGKTRAEVRADVIQALRSRDSGDIVEPTTGMTLRELNPGRYAKAHS